MNNDGSDLAWVANIGNSTLNTAYLIFACVCREKILK